MEKANKGDMTGSDHKIHTDGVSSGRIKSDQNQRGGKKTRANLLSAGQVSMQDELSS